MRAGRDKHNCLKMAAEAWNGSPPAWVVALAESCDKYDQSFAASMIKYSPPVVNQVLKKTYKGNLRRVQTAVEGALMASTVDCPEIGEMAADVCLRNQKRPFAATTPQRVRLYFACRDGCRHSQIKRTPKTAGGES